MSRNPTPAYKYKQSNGTVENDVSCLVGTCKPYVKIVNGVNTMGENG